MRVFRGLPTSADSPVALTIGNFDGVHRGHQAMLARLIEAADDLALPPAVLTFDPPPREFFAGAAAPPRLSSLREKLERFAALGVARTYVARFDGRLASLPPETFIDDVLVRRLGARWLLVGEDFRFGKGACRRPVDAARVAHARSASKRCAPSRSTASGRRRRPCALRWPPAISPCASTARTSVRDFRSRRPWREARTHARLSDGEHPAPAQAAGDRRLRGARARPRPKRRAPASPASACARLSRPPACRCSRCSSSTSTRPSTAAASASSSCTSCATRSATATSTR